MPVSNSLFLMRILTQSNLWAPWDLCTYQTTVYSNRDKLDSISTVLGSRSDWGSLFVVQEVNSKSWVTWLSIAQFAYFLREMCLFFNFWMIEIHKYVFFDTHVWNFSTKVRYMSKIHTSLKNDLVFLSLYIFWEKWFFFTCKYRILVEKFHVWMSKKHNIVNSIIQKLKNQHSSKNIQTEQC